MCADTNCDVLKGTDVTKNQILQSVDIATVTNVSVCKTYSATREGVLADKLTWLRKFVDIKLYAQQLDNLRPVFTQERRGRLGVSTASGLTHHDKADACMLVFLVENSARIDKEMVAKRGAVTTLLNTTHPEQNAASVTTLATDASKATPWYTTQGSVSDVISALHEYYKPAA